MKGRRKQIIGWAVSITFLFLAFRNVHWHEFVHTLSRVSLVGLGAMVAIYLFGFMLRGLRSVLLLPQVPPVDALGGVFVGYAANNLLPARLGEFVRAHAIGKASGIRRSTALSSVLIERIFDGTAIVALLLVGCKALTLPEWAMQLRTFGLALFSAAFLGILIVGKFHHRLSSRLPEHKVSDLIHGLLAGVELAVRNLPVLLGISILSLVIWSVESLMFYVGFLTFGFELSLRAAFFIMACVNLGVLIPSTPGGLGVFQYFAVASLGLFGIANDPASAYAIAIHLCQYLPVTIIGSIWLQRMGIKDFQTASKSAGN